MFTILEICLISHRNMPNLYEKVGNFLKMDSSVLSKKLVKLADKKKWFYQRRCHITKVEIVPYAGCGIIHNEDNSKSPFVINYGVLAQSPSGLTTGEAGKYGITQASIKPKQAVHI